MPLAKEVAAELRRLADSLDREPELETHKPSLWFHFYTKEPFTAIVRNLPRPLSKTVFLPGSNSPDVHVEYASDALRVIASIPQSLTCKLVKPAQPAVYDCEPILSDEELTEVSA